MNQTPNIKNTVRGSFINIRFFTTYQLNDE